MAELDPAVPLGGVGRAWDVLDAEGRLVRRVLFPVGFELHAVRAGRAYGVRTLEEGVHVVEGYEIDGRG